MLEKIYLKFWFIIIFCGMCAAYICDGLNWNIFNTKNICNERFQFQFKLIYFNNLVENFCDEFTYFFLFSLKQNSFPFNS